MTAGEAWEASRDRIGPGRGPGVRRSITELAKGKVPYANVFGCLLVPGQRLSVNAWCSTWPATTPIQFFRGWTRTKGFCVYRAQAVE